MSQTAHIPSHRKPRRSASSRALRAGVTGGILTLTVAGTAVSATAAEPAAAETTQELPTFSADLALNALQSADATEQAAHGYQLQDQQELAAGKAKSEAKKAKTEAERKAKEAKERAERAAAKRAAAAEKAREQQRASRTAERTTLTTTSGTSANTSGTSDSSTTSSSHAPASSQTEAPSTSTGSGNAATVISFLKAQVGKAYVPGAMGPSSYDCSGLTSMAFRQVNVDLPRVSQDQSVTGTQVSLSNLQPGDILYWGSAGSAYHVAVYIGGGQFIGAQNSNTGVVQRSMSYDMPTGAVRVL
ncbi:C40 family peptidase [Streptomyces sp. NPDC057702]|uniref:C40 family peptidase n=1 Tax=unclassified Streptomyces TaxID=2593676 RepID=UPI00367E8159